MSKRRIIVLALFALLWAGNAFGWSFAVCGDSRDDRDGIFPQILSAVDNSDMEFLLHTGDMVNKDAHFAIVDNAKGTFTDNTLAGLDRDLAAHPKGKGGITTLIVAMHIPPAVEGYRPHGTRYDYERRSAKLLAILKRRGVDAVLSGHEHMQHVEDWDGVLLLISGGAGAPLAPFQKYGYYRIDVENGKLRETFRRVRPAK